MANTRVSKKFLSTTALAVAGLMAAAPGAYADHAWVLEQVGGSFSTDTGTPNITTITQHSDRAIGVGNLDIQSYQTVNIQQNNSGSLFVAKDNRNDPTVILGRLSANGRVMVLDENGIFFGANAVIDVGGIIASTGRVDNDAVMRGDNVLTLTNFGDASVVNNGTVTVQGAGLAAFVAPHVVNNGIISARMGKVALASGGERATVDLYGDGLVEIALDGEKSKALIENAGLVEGQNVLMTAQGAKDVVDTVINMSGVVKATSATVKGGKIVLHGGSSGVVEVAGTVDASGAQGGGDVDVQGENILIADTAILRADGGNSGDGGNVIIVAQNGLVYRGLITARGGVLGGNGGFVDTSGLEWVDVWGNVDASSPFGLAGTWLIDPRNITISAGATSNNSGSPTFTPTGNNSVIQASVINTALNVGGGTNVIIDTNTGGGFQFGDITIEANILKSSGSEATLTLNAARHIVQNAGTRLRTH